MKSNKNTINMEVFDFDQENLKDKVKYCSAGLATDS